MPIEFYKLFYYASKVLYRCLSICVLKLPNIVCEEFVEKRSLFTKGEGFSMLNQDLFGTRGFSSWEFSHLHRFLDSTFAASFV